MSPDILLPNERDEFLGRSLVPNNTSPILENAFNFSSVYRTADGQGVSFVAPFGKDEKDTRITMSIDDFVAMNLAEEGRDDTEHLTDDELNALRGLGFTNEVISDVVKNAVEFNKLQAKRK